MKAFEASSGYRRSRPSSPGLPRRFCFGLVLCESPAQTLPHLASVTYLTFNSEVYGGIAAIAWASYLLRPSPTTCLLGLNRLISCPPEWRLPSKATHRQMGSGLALVSVRDGTKVVLLAADCCNVALSVAVSQFLLPIPKPAVHRSVSFALFCSTINGCLPPTIRVRTTTFDLYRRHAPP
ncbi:hypothetical protein DFH94DRAFT_115026 [Russula ochroleuca]|uniref:Uncharacterized protein n=1 Tax=Russula ochroleuca TaxID=152965 RepID=A0A9P5MR88_9AGAM|nr:hypothetical protein DFH94DRAFT_115026 [Russula ochroleuca]